MSAHPDTPRAEGAAPASISVVVPFAGDARAATRTVERFAALRLGPHDEIVLADNSRDGAAAGLTLPPGWRRVVAPAEGTPAHARNAGARAARGDWLLFVDSDCRPHPDLLERHRAAPDADLVAGAVVSAANGSNLATRHAASRGRLDQRTALNSPFPWAHTANLLVARATFERLGGFHEGIFNGEDVDFCWRAQRAGHVLAHAPGAVVEHEHRETIRGLLRQTRAAAASVGWVHRRWPDVPAPRAPWRTLGRALLAAPAFAATGQFERARLKALDGLLAAGDIAARGAGNRPRWVARRPGASRVGLQVWCDRFPVLSETFVTSEARALARLGHPVEVVATRRPDVPAARPADLAVRWLEDDTRLEKLVALGWLAAHRPARVMGDLLARRRWRREEPVTPLRALAPAARRLHRSPGVRIHVHFAGEAALDALRVSALVGRGWSLTAHAYDIYQQPRNLVEKVRSADLVTSGCDYTVRDLRRVAGPAHADAVHRIVMGIDPDAFRRAAPYPEGAVVVAVGRLVEKKGFVHLVRAAADPALEGLLERVRIVGEGPLRGELEAEVRRLGLHGRVELTGALAPEQVRAVLEGAALFAMPCVVAADGDRDSQPVVVKEALAMEVPVVVSDEVGLPELVRPEFGRIVPPASPAALAGAMAELLALPREQRIAMGRAGRAFVSRHAHVATEAARLSELLEARA